MIYNNKTKQQILAKRDMAKFEHKLRDFCDHNGVGFELFYDQFSGLFYKATPVTVLAAELAINRELANNGECPVAMYYDMLGIDYSTIMLDQQYYWSNDNGVYWIDFDHIWVDSEVHHPPYHLLCMIPEPTYVKGDIAHVI